MRNSPVLLSRVIRREKTIVYAIADLIQPAGNYFGESLLVEYLVG